MWATPNSGLHSTSWTHKQWLKCMNANVTELGCLSSWVLWIESTTAHKHSEENHGEFFKQPKYKSSKKPSLTSDSQRNVELERVWNSCDTFILSAVWLKKASSGLPTQLSIYMLLIMITFFLLCSCNVGSFACPLCSTPATLRDILTASNMSLPHGRFTWRHN